MKTLALTFMTALFLTQAQAKETCPELQGDYHYDLNSSLTVNQSQDAEDITTYKVTIDDGNCAVCHYDQYFRADGQLVQKKYAGGRRIESTQVFCENQRLKFRQTTENLDNQGQVISSYSENYDYRINDQDAFVIEDIRNGVPYSKTVHPRAKQN